MSAAPPGRIPEIVRYFLRLGLLGFGGPVALVGQMERELVAGRGGLDERAFLIAAAIGTILGASVMLGGIAIGDWFTVLVGLLSLAALFRWKVTDPLLMAVTAALGYVAFAILHPAWVMIQ